jgi:hypothetical protein
MPNTLLILGITAEDCAAPFLVDPTGKLPGGDGEIICPSTCAAGGKAYLGNGTQVLTLINFSGSAIANPIKIFTWSTTAPPSLTLSNMTLLGEYEFGDDVKIAFTKTKRYISVFAINSGSGFYDGCCFSVEKGFIKVLGF